MKISWSCFKTIHIYPSYSGRADGITKGYVRIDASNLDFKFKA